MQLTAHAHPALSGTARIPGDKSIAHRALMLGAVAQGETIIDGLLESDDVLATAAALRALGVRLHRAGSGLWHVHGKGIEALQSPAAILDFGNSGTGARLMAGLLGGSTVTATFTGDESLRRRPMKRVLEPLSAMGVTVLAREDGLMPFTLRGAGTTVRPLRYELPVPSAQVKSALLLAGLFATGDTVITEPRATRDHSEIMLRHFGAAITRTGNDITLRGGARLSGCALAVPADPSAAAFAVAAAVMTAGSAITLPRIGVNPTRTGFYDALREMGAHITVTQEKTENGEPTATITAQGGHDLRGIDVAPARIPAMIDEIPVLAVVASCARGRTILRGLAELRVKESDRLTLMARGLAACGVTVTVTGDDLVIDGDGRPPPGGALIDTGFDHRIAMSFLVLGGAAARPVTIDNDRSIGTSFPGFAALMNGLGARIAAPEQPVFAAWDE